MPTTSLDALPIEVVEMIVGFLEPHDVGSVRLTGHSMALKVSQGHFRTYFHKKALRVTIQSLTAFNDLLQPNSPVYLLEDATIVGLISRTTPDQAEVNNLLVRAFVALKAKGVCLRSLSLNVVTGDDDLHDADRDYVRSQSAIVDSGIVEATMVALQESGLSVLLLDLFGTTIGHSVPFGLIGQLPDFTRLSSSTKCIKSLSLSLNSTLRTAGVADNLATTNTAPEQTIASITQLLDLMPKLEELDLRWFMSRSELNASIDSREIFFFNHCFKSITAAPLRTCSLRGLYISEEALLSFLQQSSVKRVTLREIHLQKDGKFISILDTLTRDTDPFEYFHLDDLFEDTRLLYFKVPGQPKFPIMGGGVGPSEVVREGDEVKQKLEYTFAMKRALGSPQVQRWRRNRAKMYGNTHWFR
ncbi:hypothetical protein MMC15_006478 [Xylographa vitiligo]|nr:hypothetical protein [Xylographa vitiligo]